MAFKYRHIHKNIPTIKMSVNSDFIICIALPRYQLFAVGFIIYVLFTYYRIRMHDRVRGLSEWIPQNHFIIPINELHCYVLCLKIIGVPLLSIFSFLLHIIYKFWCHTPQVSWKKHLEHFQFVQQPFSVYYLFSPNFPFLFLNIGTKRSNLVCICVFA